MIRCSLERPEHVPGRTNGPIRIRVKRCTNPGAWYEERIGEEVVAEFMDSEGYWAREGGIYNCINVLRKEDVTVLD